jgi:hypothetical protein
VLEGRRGTCLAQKTRLGFAIATAVRTQDLDGNAAQQFRIESAIDIAHAPGSKARLDPELPDEVTRL